MRLAEKRLPGKLSPASEGFLYTCLATYGMVDLYESSVKSVDESRLRSGEVRDGDRARKEGSRGEEREGLG